MASYTTPRTANVGDIFTAAWYNAELRDDIKWVHDTLISVGSVFPTSPTPLTGQRHLFVSGKTRRMFTYDGTNWISEPFVVDVYGVEYAVVPENVSTTHGMIFGANGIVANQGLVDVADELAAGCTVQGRITVSYTDGGGSAAHIGLNVQTVAAIGTDIGAVSAAGTEISGTEVTGAGIQFGNWADLATGTIVAIRPRLYAYRASGGTFGVSITAAQAWIRFKK